MSQHNAKDKWLARLTEALADGTFAKLTLASYRGGDDDLKNVFVRAVELRGGPRLSFVYRYATRDVTKNFEHPEAIELLADLVGTQFKKAHLFTTRWTSEIEFREGKPARLIEGRAAHAAPPSTAHDQTRRHALVPENSPWLRGLDVATSEGRIARGMESKFRQINKFVELLAPLIPAGENLAVVDMGCGKGYLTFAAHESLRAAGRSVSTLGIESRPALVELCNRVAKEHQIPGLAFATGQIADAPLDRADIIIALHACDTATDDAIARGISAGARLILVAPCCHKELRPQLTPAAPLETPLRHGIFRERQAEFITDALRVELLEWAGYEARAFEFIATEHTGKNLMIAATRRGGTARDEVRAMEIRELARLYGVRTHQLARHLAFDLRPDALHR